VTRAVINFTSDISFVIPVWAKAIPTAAYNKEIPILGFRYKNWRVIISAEEIMIKDLQTEAEAREVMDYLKKILDKN
jgi:ArsR family metal-binding transcriptional regulator